MNKPRLNQHGFIDPAALPHAIRGGAKTPAERAAERQADADRRAKWAAEHPQPARPAPDPVIGRPETAAEQRARLMHRLSTPTAHPAAGETRTLADLAQVTASEKSAAVARRLGLAPADGSAPPERTPADDHGIRAAVRASNDAQERMLFRRKES